MQASCKSRSSLSFQKVARWRATGVASGCKVIRRFFRGSEAAHGTWTCSNFRRRCESSAHGVESAQSSMLDNTDHMMDINARIAARVRDLRAAADLSLEELARRSDVSRSMLSLVERAETSPSAVVLEKIATGLKCTLASLFDDGNAPAQVTQYTCPAQ